MSNPRNATPSNPPSHQFLARRRFAQRRQRQRVVGLRRQQLGIEQQRPLQPQQRLLGVAHFEPRAAQGGQEDGVVVARVGGNLHQAQQRGLGLRAARPGGGGQRGAVRRRRGQRIEVGPGFGTSRRAGRDRQPDQADPQDAPRRRRRRHASRGDGVVCWVAAATGVAARTARRRVSRCPPGQGSSAASSVPVAGAETHRSSGGTSSAASAAP